MAYFACYILPIISAKYSAMSSAGREKKNRMSEHIGTNSTQARQDIASKKDTEHTKALHSTTESIFANHLIDCLLYTSRCV